MLFSLETQIILANQLQKIESVQTAALSLILQPFKSTPTIALESELNILSIDIRLKQLQAMECIKILRKRDNPLKDRIMQILETPTAYLSPLQHLAKVGKELLVKITKTRITNISDVKIEPEPMITSTTTHNISIENICTKDKRKDYDNNFINNQIQNFPNDTIVIFTDGSCQNNPGPTGVGSLVFKDRINNPLIKFAKAVSKFSMKYHGELEAILLSLKYIRTINLIGIKKVHIFTDSMSSFQAITSKKQQESFNDIIEEIKRISNELRTLNFAITHVFSHIDIKFNEEADKLAKVEVKLASKYHQTKELTISTAKKANKNHSTEIWGIR